ncbi:UNVERIFIED_CONTAM: hypothetical protein LK11_39055 [Mumia flava]
MLVLSSCGGDEAGDDEITIGGATTSATSTPTDDAGSIRTSYPGLEITELPAVDDEYGPALETYVAFEEGRRRMYETTRVGPLVRRNASPPVEDQMRAIARSFRDADSRLVGTNVLEVDAAESSDTMLALAVCSDTASMEVESAGTREPLEGDPRTMIDVTLTAAGGVWLVTDYTWTEDSC